MPKPWGQRVLLQLRNWELALRGVEGGETGVLLPTHLVV